jgi:O-antigen ligase
MIRSNVATSRRTAVADRRDLRGASTRIKARNTFSPDSASIPARSLGYGLALLPLIGATVPFTIGTGTSSGVVAALLLAIALLGTWGARLVLARNVIVIRSPVALPGITMAIIWILAVISSNVYLDPRIAARLGTAFTIVQIAAAAVTVVSIGLLLLGTNIGVDGRYARVATWSMLAVGVVDIAAYYLRVEQQLSALNTNGLFTLWTVCLSYGQALFNQRLSYLARLGLLSLAAAFLVKVAVFQTFWLSGWVPSIVAVGLLTLVRSRPLFLVGLLGAAIFGASHADRIYEEVFQSQVDEGSDSRLDIWSQAWDLLSQHPLLGTGPAGYAAYYMTFYSSSGSSMSTHSNYVDVAAQTGIIGSIAFVWLLVMLGVAAYQACRRWKDGFEGGFVRAGTAGFVGVVMAMALGDWLIPFVYNQGIQGFRYTVHSWVFLGLVVGLANARAEQAEH